MVRYILLPDQSSPFPGPNSPSIHITQIVALCKAMTINGSHTYTRVLLTTSTSLNILPLPKNQTPDLNTLPRGPIIPSRLESTMRRLSRSSIPLRIILHEHQSLINLQIRNVMPSMLVTGSYLCDLEAFASIVDVVECSLSRSR